MKPGTKVRMSRGLRKELINNDCMEHVMEFGRCIGVVLGPLDYNNVPKSDPTYDPHKVGPEVDVRWLPNNLKYGYHPDKLEPVRYDAEYVQEAFQANYQTYYIKLATGQSPTWKCDERTLQLYGLFQYLMEQLVMLETSDEDRHHQQWFFNRKSRAEEDLFSLVALTLNNYLDGKTDQYKGR